MRWGRIVIGAVLVEVVLVVIAVPLLPLLANPFVTPDGARSDFTTFFVSVAAACLVAGALVGWWVARPLSSGFAIHGALTGIIATAIYLGICSIPPTTVAAVFSAYGPFWFVLANGLRVAGSTLGAAWLGSRHRA
jgi:Kef-type K+ transport system membrane component KefB